MKQKKPPIKRNYKDNKIVQKQNKKLHVKQRKMRRQQWKYGKGNVFLNKVTAPPLPSEKRKLWKKIILITFGLLAALAVAAAVLWNVRITEIEVTGNEQCTAKEIQSMIFENPDETRFLYAWFQEMFRPHKQLIRLESYQLNLKGIQGAELSVKENKIIGCIEYIHSYMYFDKNGVIVKSTTEPLKEIPTVSGVNFKKIVLNEKLETEPADIFQAIVQIMQNLNAQEITADAISLNQIKNYFQLQIGDIQVILGNKVYLEEKIAELKGMLQALNGRKGVLHLENYDNENPNQDYYFKVTV